VAVGLVALLALRRVPVLQGSVLKNKET